VRLRTGSVFAVAAGVALCVFVGAGANAMWSTGASTSVPPMQVGRVQFSAQSDDDARSFSTGGEAIDLRIPGKVIGRVLDQVGRDPEPVIWRFSVAGAALGITGLDYDVHATAQIARNGDRTALADGTATGGTLLANSTMTIYPASVNGDCSSVPDVPADQDGRNVRIVGGDGATLQEPDANPSGATVTTEWCSAITWNRSPDGRYVNQVSAFGTGDNGEERSALDVWSAAVAFPPSLDPLGAYRNSAEAEAVGEDGSPSRDDDTWAARVFPDPSKEPDLELELDPTVTNVNPSVPTGDHADVGDAH